MPPECGAGRGSARSSPQQREAGGQAPPAAPQRVLGRLARDLGGAPGLLVEAVRAWRSPFGLQLDPLEDLAVDRSGRSKPHHRASAAKEQRRGDHQTSAAVPDQVPRSTRPKMVPRRRDRHAVQPGAEGSTAVRRRCSTSTRRASTSSACAAAARPDLPRRRCCVIAALALFFHRAGWSAVVRHTSCPQTVYSEIFQWIEAEDRGRPPRAHQALTGSPERRQDRAQVGRARAVAAAGGAGRRLHAGGLLHADPRHLAPHLAQAGHRLVARRSGRCPLRRHARTATPAGCASRSAITCALRASRAR